MSIVDDTKDNQIKEVKNKIEEYESTIRAGQSFISLVTWENSHKLDSAHYSIGRRMTTSENNLIIKSVEVTPDIVIQRSPSLGYVVEIKRSLPKDTREWKNVVEQIIKYDDNLIGWWNLEDESITNQCVVLLIHHARSRNFVDFFADYIKTNNIQPHNDVSIVEFQRSDEGVQFYFLRKEYGKIKSEEIDQKLYSGIQIPIEKVIVTYGNQQFNDCEPPFVEYTMSILWQQIFNSIKGPKIDPKLKSYPIDINVNLLTEELQKINGSMGNSHREVKFPHIGWIRAAMDAFVDLEYAIKTDDDNYRVYFKYIREDPIDHFVKKRKIPKLLNSQEDKQLSLF